MPLRLQHPTAARSPRVREVVPSASHPRARHCTVINCIGPTWLRAHLRRPCCLVEASCAMHRGRRRAKGAGRAGTLRTKRLSCAGQRVRLGRCAVASCERVRAQSFPQHARMPECPESLHRSAPKTVVRTHLASNFAHVVLELEVFEKNDRTALVLQAHLGRNGVPDF